MNFHIGQALLIERTLVVSATILFFGFLSVGGLWLWRRTKEGKNGASFEANVRSVEMASLIRAVERLSATAAEARGTSQPHHEPLTPVPHP
jgi:hypothetical protein